jgi:hypothetical protein
MAMFIGHARENARLKAIDKRANDQQQRESHAEPRRQSSRAPGPLVMKVVI